MSTPDVFTPADLIARHAGDFGTVLPTHVHSPVWVRVAQAAVRKDANLGQAAAANPGSLMNSLLNAARLGLEPGTEQFYLTPRNAKNAPGGKEVLGIVGYQGIIELMYRAGAVSSVVAEVVYANDKFDYQPGADETPRHTIDWDAPDRGKLRLTYAYARMHSGAVSKVVVLNRAEIEKIKTSAKGANSAYSPWSTNEAAMWLKSAVRQLGKWVPTSAEHRDQLRLDAQGVARAKVEAAGMVNTSTGELIDAADAEYVDVTVEQVDE